MPGVGYMTGIHLQLLPENLKVIHSMKEEILIQVIKISLNTNRLARAGFFLLCRQGAGKIGQLK